MIDLVARACIAIGAAYWLGVFAAGQAMQRRLAQLDHLRDTGVAPHPGDQPDVSIVVAARDEGATIGAVVDTARSLIG
ncbi:MAG: hypothetical protein H7287_05435, partial [Thermoleophilia bacterium]|nr:hypothetical protein [Thermoleophilia bacterium]